MSFPLIRNIRGNIWPIWFSICLFPFTSALSPARQQFSSVRLIRGQYCDWPGVTVGPEERRGEEILNNWSTVKYAAWLALSGSGILLGVETTSRGGGDDTNQANNNANITDVLTYTLIIFIFILTQTCIWSIMAETTWPLVVLFLYQNYKSWV